MKTINLKRKRHSLSEVLALAKSETVLIRSASGEAFLLEAADEFDSEVASLGGSASFMSLLDARSKETGDIPLKEVRRRRGV